MLVLTTLTLFSSSAFGLIPQPDQDGDGYDISADCDDTNPNIYPGAPETIGDGVDSDCDGTDGAGAPIPPPPLDDDGDGWDYFEDCDDNDASIHPGATEIPGDGIDQDCDGLVDEASLFCDSDGDGYGHPDPDIACIDLYPPADNGDDCDDNDASIHPGADEIPGDGIDQDCDGVADQPLLYCDSDGDGYGQPDPNIACIDLYPPADNGDDCDDNDASIHPGADDIPGDGIDQDCDGADLPLPDEDEDGYDTSVDCDDSDPLLNPGAVEACDGIDNNCDGATDEDCPVDDDSDGWTSDTDCDDNDASVHPDATEVCGDAVDQDCNGVAEACEPDDIEPDKPGCSTIGTTGIWSMLLLPLFARVRRAGQPA